MVLSRLQPTQPCPQLPDPVHGLLVAARVDQPTNLAKGTGCNPQIGLAQLNTVFSGKAVQPFNAAHHEMAVGGMGNRAPDARAAFRY